MARRQTERLDFADPSRDRYLRRNFEADSFSDAGFYYKFSGTCRRLAAAIAGVVPNRIRPSDGFFGSCTTAGFFTPAELRFASLGLIAALAGLAALLCLSWSETEAGPVSATELRLDPLPPVETLADEIDGARRGEPDSLRADLPEDHPAPSAKRGDRLEVRDAAIKLANTQPAMRIATASEDDIGIAPSAPTPLAPAASKPAVAKEKHAKAKEKRAERERPAHHRHARHASRHQRERTANPKYMQVSAEPQAVQSGGPQADQAPPEENKTSGWVTRLRNAMRPSSWKSSWDNVRAKGNGS